METQKPKNYWTACIRPRTGWFDIDLKGLWRYKGLIWLFVKRDFKLVYKQTILGPIWVIIQPLLTTVVFTVVFGNIAALPTDGMPRFLFYMAGNICWRYFSTCLEQTSRTFIGNKRLFSKVYFPRLCIPIGVVVYRLINFLIQFVLFLGFMIYYATRPNSAVNPNWKMIMLFPLLLLQIGVLGLGFGIIVSSVTTRYRDLNLLVGFGVHLWMYITPVAYPTSTIIHRLPGAVRLFYLNPMTSLIELFRAAFLGTTSFNVNYYWVSLGMTLIVFAIGVVLFSHVEKTFMDVV